MHHADAVVVLRDAHGAAIHGLVVEVQLRRDPRKQFSWIVYLALLRARKSCELRLSAT